MICRNAQKKVKSELSGFEEAFRSIPKNRILKVRKEIMTRLNWSISLFYYKKRGDTPIWENEVPFLEEIFSEYGINPWKIEENDTKNTEHGK
ncbi:MAG TPA: hypothetical protein VHO46_06930 [Bacteroidales bacterium]|nr:hypothetical protein [Bacteroidales bacterium]